MPSSGKKNKVAAEIDQDALSLKALAKGVIAREFRPRASSVRRLAEAVLDPSKPRKKNKDDFAKADKSSGNKRRLAKIPGQKGKKKKKR